MIWILGTIAYLAFPLLTWYLTLFLIVKNDREDLLNIFEQTKPRNLLAANVMIFEMCGDFPCRFFWIIFYAIMIPFNCAMWALSHCFPFFANIEDKIRERAARNARK